MGALEHDAEIQAALFQSLQTAEASLGLINANYQAGLVNYLQVLTVNSQFRQAKIPYLQALAQRFQDTVALFVALGGGWADPGKNVPDSYRRRRYYEKL